MHSITFNGVCFYQDYTFFLDEYVKKYRNSIIEPSHEQIIFNIIDENVDEFYEIKQILRKLEEIRTYSDEDSIINKFKIKKLNSRIKFLKEIEAAKYENNVLKKFSFEQLELINDFYNLIRAQWNYEEKKLNARSFVNGGISFLECTIMNEIFKDMIKKTITDADYIKEVYSICDNIAFFNRFNHYSNYLNTNVTNSIMWLMDNFKNIEIVAAFIEEEGNFLEDYGINLSKQLKL